MAKPTEFTLFIEYGRKIKKFLMENMYLSRYGDGADNVNVTYASPPRAFAKFLVPVINGSNLNPTVAFYLSNIEYLGNENLLGFVSEKVRVSDTAFKYIPPPIICKLTYKVSIMVANETDGDILQYQILANARKQRPHAFAVDGQWATCYTENPSNDTNIEPGEIQDKVSRRSVDLVIPRAYLPLDYDLYDGIIREINIAYETAEDTGL